MYEAPAGDEPPPFWIRCLLILTCTAVSFPHGSNDRQKGTGLIMLILIGIVPTAYALNHAIPANQTADFVAVSQQAVRVMNSYVDPSAPIGNPQDQIEVYVRSRKSTPGLPLAIRQLSIISPRSSLVLRASATATFPNPE